MLSLRGMSRLWESIMLTTRPDPWPDVTLGLPLLSEVVHVKLPDSNESPQLAVSALTYNMPRPVCVTVSAHTEERSLPRSLLAHP